MYELCNSHNDNGRTLLLHLVLEAIYASPDVTGSVTMCVQVVREKLVALEIPFVQHTTVRGSPKRQLLVDKYGKFAVPYLEVSSACVRLHVPYRVVGLILHGKHASSMRYVS